MQHNQDTAHPIDTNALGLQLFESSPDCVKLLSNEGKVLAMNRNGMCAMEIDDFSPFSGAAWRAFWPQESQDAIDAALALARTGGTGQITAFCPTVKGAPRWWQVAVTAVRAENGQIQNLLAVSRDVTAAHEAEIERERLLKELQAANARMADIFHQAPAFMCVLAGPEHRFELVNERYRQLVGNRDLIGQPIRQALPDVAGQGFFELLDTVYRTGEPYFGTDMPVMLQRHPGAAPEQRFVDLVYMALRDADGNISGLLAHGIDQTERKRAEFKLFESRERFAQLVGQAATGVVETDPQGRITFVNQKYCDMLGRSEAELIGMGVAEVTAPESLAATLAGVAGVMAGGPGFVIDKHYLHKDGTLVPATSSVNALRGPAGEFQGLVAIVLDTSATHQAAEQLRASEERYRTLFESMDQGFSVIEMLFDADDVPVDYRFEEMNAMFERQTGLVDATGKTARELVPNLDRFWFDTYGRVALSGEAVRFENEAAAMGRWFDVYATRIGGADSRKVALLFTDISARKRNEEQLRRLAADLSDADRRKTEFLATLAHELRNPLAPIRSGLGVMRLSGDNPAAVRKVRDMMERQVGHMVHLIDDLLDVARISGGKLELKRERADLRRVLGSAVETSAPLIDAARHQLHVSLPETALIVDADVTRIAQVVANLLNNAAKYTPAGGRIDLSLRAEDGMALIVVSDTGVGIPADSLESVFDMFKQVDRHMERAQGGLGIGLSLVRRLVEMHGGAVSAASAGAGRGSTFEVRLPLAGAEVLEAPLLQEGRSAAAAQGQAIRILVVDDNVDAALTLAMILEASGHLTRVAHDGIAALALAREFLPQVAFLDIGMPGLNGYETASAMRRTPGLEDVTLVALTGWGTESDRLRSSDAGFDHHLTKPAQLSAVQDLLNSLAHAGSGT
ncbi:MULTISPECIES: PAS domain-containing protein [unclassified Massilia]|uniref:PAS domain-containing hybrid sensor histidine kinase/response regulator n=1 Tax=unclassified Massilia TaxID=2609279 RepID=UPI00177CC631|nr:MULTISPECIES: PAS domain-containing protein [unclassified Massilia]MBD8532043.1 PAS domain-containing protein [Massilia sp. CFBP 13647]MBD8675489.1 PAS domain-containing protein [Massilia sp. CFBP 13721]